MMTSINPHERARYPRAVTTTMLMAGLTISPPIHHLPTMSAISPIALTSGSTLWDITSGTHQITNQLQSLPQQTPSPDHLLGSWTSITVQTHLEQAESPSLAHIGEDLHPQGLGSVSVEPLTAIPLPQDNTPEPNFAEEATIITSVVGGNTIIETWTPLVVNGTPENVNVPAVSGITVIPESVAPLSTASEGGVSPREEIPSADHELSSVASQIPSIVEEPTAAGEGPTIIHEVPLSDIPEAPSPEEPVPSPEIIPPQPTGLDFSLFSLITNLFDDVIDMNEVLFGDAFRVGADLVEDIATGLGEAITDLWDLNSTFLSGLFTPRAVTFPLLADQGGYADDITDIVFPQDDHDHLSGFLADQLSGTEWIPVENSDLGEWPALETHLDEENIPNLDLDW